MDTDMSVYMGGSCRTLSDLSQSAVRGGEPRTLTNGWFYMGVC